MSPRRASRPQGRLLFSVAGVPHSARDPGTLAGLERVAELGLDGLELEFVHGVRIGDQTAEQVRKRAAELGVALTCHGPYYINLASLEADKRAASVERILATARAAKKVGARSITFHAAFYMQQPPAEVYRIVRAALVDIRKVLQREDNQVQIRPELTGKPSQFGDLEELLALAQEIPGVWPCIDFSHLHARTNGGFNSLEAFGQVLERYAAVLGRAALADLHMHVSGIDFGPKGERKHLEFGKSGFNYRDLLRALKRTGAGGVLVCESPIQEDDALLLKRTHQRIRV